MAPKYDLEKLKGMSLDEIKDIVRKLKNDNPDLRVTGKKADLIGSILKVTGTKKSIKISSPKKTKTAAKKSTTKKTTTKKTTSSVSKKSSAVGSKKRGRPAKGTTKSPSSSKKSSAVGSKKRGRPAKGTTKKASSPKSSPKSVAKKTSKSASKSVKSKISKISKASSIKSAVKITKAVLKDMCDEKGIKYKTSMSFNELETLCTGSAAKSAAIKTAEQWKKICDEHGVKYRKNASVTTLAKLCSDAEKKGKSPSASKASKTSKASKAKTPKKTSKAKTPKKASPKKSAKALCHDDDGEDCPEDTWCGISGLCNKTKPRFYIKLKNGKIVTSTDKKRLIAFAEQLGLDESKIKVYGSPTKKPSKKTPPKPSSAKKPKASSSKKPKKLVVEESSDEEEEEESEEEEEEESSDEEEDPLNGCRQDSCEDSEICDVGTGKCVDRAAGQWILTLVSGQAITGSKETLEKLRNTLGGRLDKTLPVPSKQGKKPLPPPPSRPALPSSKAVSSRPKGSLPALPPPKKSADTVKVDDMSSDEIVAAFRKCLASV